MRLTAVVLSIVLSGCRTASGLDERASALLADYHSRARAPVAEGDRTQWAAGQFTVHLWKVGERHWLERAAITELRPGKIRVALDRLGAGTQVRVVATLTDRPTDRASFERSLTEAWVREDERPEVHHQGSVPRWVAEALFLATERPTGSAIADLDTPAGRFPGSSGGVHPAVPLSGVVTIDRSGTKRELLEFGDDGGGALY